MISMKSEFIALWDGFTTAQNAQVLVLTATNRLSKLDESNTLMSPSSFWNWCFGSKGKGWDIKCYLEGWEVWRKHWLWIELLGEEKKGGDILVSWTLWYFNSAVVIALIHHRFCCNSNMVSKICCCNGAATHTGFLIYYVAAICWFSML